MQNEELKNFIHQELCNFKDLFFKQVNQKFKQVNQRFEEVNQKFEQVNQKFEQVNQRFEEVNQKFEQVNQRFEEVNQRFGEVNLKINELDSNLKSLSNTVTLIEHDHGEKLVALMDYMVVNDERHNKFDKNFRILKNTIENHSMRIDEIEKSINY